MAHLRNLVNAVIKHAGSTRTAGNAPRSSVAVPTLRTRSKKLSTASLTGATSTTRIFLRRTVRVEFQTAPDGKYRVPPKTPRSRRALPLPEVVGKALAAHIAEFPPTEDGSLFTTANGNLYRHEHYGARIFTPSVKKAELLAGTTSHALRHRYASVLLAAGESVVAVAEKLGHENAALVLKTYGHLMPDSEDRTRRAIDDAWTSDGTQTESDHR
jgi:integrase